MSQHIMKMGPGDRLSFKGLVPSFRVGRNQFKSVGIVAKGDGVCAAVQVITKLLSDPRDDTEIRLFYSARSPAHIMLRNTIDALALIHPRFKATIAVDTPDEAWDGAVGAPDREALAAILPPPSEKESTIILVAGDGPHQRALTGKDRSVGAETKAEGVLGDMRYAPGQIRSL